MNDIRALPPSELSRAEQLALMEPGPRAKVLDGLTEDELEGLKFDFEFNARPDQMEPTLEEISATGAKDWDLFLLKCGRGAGKTWPGAHIVHRFAMANPGAIIGIVAPTPADARDICLGPPSGLLHAITPAERPVHRKTDKQVIWANGSIGYLRTGAEPEDLRGFNWDLVWWDELPKFRYLQESWDNGQLGLRGSGRVKVPPRQIVTSTPLPLPLFRELASEKRPGFIERNFSTYRNIAHLPAPFVAKLLRKYEGTRLGRQELYGEVLEDIEGALWKLSTIDCQRLRLSDGIPTLHRIVIAVDPSGTATGDECGIIICGIGPSGHVYVLADLSLKGSPEQWIKVVLDAYKLYQADRVVAEVNFGGDLVETAMNMAAGHKISFTKIHASRAKIVRAEPVAALYERGQRDVIIAGGDRSKGLVHHVGAFSELEKEMSEFVPGASDSPNRMDALVFGVTFLAQEAITSGRAGFYSAPRPLPTTSVLPSSTRRVPSSVMASTAGVLVPRRRIIGVERQIITLPDLRGDE